MPDRSTREIAEEIVRAWIGDGHEQMARAIATALDAERVGRERAERMYANSQDTVSEVTAALEQAEAERDDAIEDAQIGGAHWQKIYNVLKAERDRLREALTTLLACCHGDETTCGCRDQAQRTLVEHMTPTTETT